MLHVAVESGNRKRTHGEQGREERNWRWESEERNEMGGGV